LHSANAKLAGTERRKEGLKKIKKDLGKRKKSLSLHPVRTGNRKEGSDSRRAVKKKEDSNTPLGGKI
jgi:hypothetical protein